MEKNIEKIFKIEKEFHKLMLIKEKDLGKINENEKYILEIVDIITFINIFSLSVEEIISKVIKELYPYIQEKLDHPENELEKNKIKAVIELLYDYHIKKNQKTYLQKLEDKLDLLK